MKYFTVPTFAFAVLSLAACGGGISGGSSTLSTNTATPRTADVSVAWDSPNSTIDQQCSPAVTDYTIYAYDSTGTYSANFNVSANAASCSNTTESNTCGTIQTCGYTVRGVRGFVGGQWHFAVSASDSNGNEGALSYVASYTIN